jgi:hypothetical protein
LIAEIEAYGRTLGQNRPFEADNSNTQFAILGVWVARRSGLEAEDALARIEKRFLATQFPETGTWPYDDRGGGAGPSMTCAGLIALATAVGRREERRLKAEAPAKVQKKDPSKPAPKSDDPFDSPPPKKEGDPIRGGKKPPAQHLRQPIDLAIERGFKGLGAYLVANRAMNPYPPGPYGEGDLYFFWSLERVGVLFGTDKIGGVDWYDAGAASLLAFQTAQGSWVGGRYTPEVNTSFAILFLTKANVARDLTSRINKETDTELRAGSGSGDTKPKPTPAPPPAATVTEPPTSPPGEVVKPQPAPAADESAKLAAELVRSSAADWQKNLERFRDTKGAAYTSGLAAAIRTLDGDRKKQAREALAERLTRMTADTLRTLLKGADVELRRAATLACAMKDDKTHVPDLIDQLTDEEDIVVRAAKAGLKSLTGKDLGPVVGADKEERKKAAAAWREWWSKEGK